MRKPDTPVILVLIATATTLFAWRMDQALNSSPAADLSPAKDRLPPYKVDDCFARNGVREPWDPEADGIVVQVGDAQYLTIWHTEAERRSPTKRGLALTTETLEQQFHPTACPARWIARPWGKKPQR